MRALPSTHGHDRRAVLRERTVDAERDRRAIRYRSRRRASFPGACRQSFAVTFDPLAKPESAKR